MSSFESAVSIANKSVLFCSVDSLVRSVITRSLELEGVKVYAAPNGNDAKEIIKNNAPDLVVTEEMLPYQSGFELIKVCDEIGIPSIIIADADLENKILEAFDLGAYDFIDKPYSPNELIVRIKNIFRHQKQ